MTLSDKWFTAISQNEDNTITYISGRSDIDAWIQQGKMKERIEVLPQAWQYEREHRTYYTDMFGFSGETTYRIKLRLGYLSAHLLMEEYGVQAYQLVILDEKHWLFSTRVCSMQGIGRFVMGLCNDIEILEGTELKQYISGVLQKLTKSVKNE